MTTTNGRRVLAMGSAVVVLGAVALTFPLRSLHASAQNINACGTLWSDSSSDASAGVPAAQSDQLDIVSGTMSDNGTTLTTTLTIKNLTTTVATGTTASEYYLVWAFNGVNYFTSAENATGTGVSYAYGTYSSTTGFSSTGAATGTFGSGLNGTITVSVALSAVGSPVAGDAFAAAGIFGQTGTLSGAGGSGLVSTVDKDASAYDYEVGQSCTGATPTPSATPSPTTTTTSTASGGTCTAGSPEQNIAQNGFICPVELPSSGGLGEPTLIHDDGAHNGGTPALFVAAPQGIGNVQQGGSPLYTSLDGGLHWGAPVRSTLCTGTSGGDTDLVTDNADNVYLSDLWLGNSCLTVSETTGTGPGTSAGGSFTAGDPFGTQPVPGDDRPWLALNAASDVVYATYDGETGLYLTNTAPVAANPAVGIQTVAQSLVVPEVAVSSSSIPPGARACVCPPGGVAVDNTSGKSHSHTNRVYVSYSHQAGMAIAYMDPTCTPAGCVSGTWTQVVIPDNTSGSAFQDEFNFAPLKVDGNGTAYVMWSHALGFTGGLAGSGGVQEYYSFSIDGGASWHSPILLSTEAGTTTFPTMDVAADGTLDAAWYGTTATGDPNSVPGTATWNIYYARVTAADTAAPVFTPEVAVQDMHNGCIQTGGGKSCTDRSLLDFFQLTSDPGSPNIIYTAGDVAGGVNLWFTKFVFPPANVAEVPLAPILLLPAAVVVILLTRRRLRGRAFTDVV